MTRISQRRTLAAALLIAAVAAGLLWRNAPLHLPFVLWKYGGSALWAIAVYWLLATLFPQLRPVTLAILAGLIALAVEFSRLIPYAPLDAFRLTLPGKLLLGRIFSVRNIAAYWVAIAVSAVLDRFYPKHTGRSL